MAQSKHSSLSLFFVLSLFLCCTSYTKSFEYVQDELKWLDDEISIAERTQSSRETCDYTKGKWVYDQSYPLYNSDTCPYLSSAVTCQENGRPDSDYEKWRWKPNGCSIPRFSALDFLGKMRRKRIMLVGDSIIRNQWESLVCLVQSVVPMARKTVIYNGPTMAFLALDYEMSIEFCWAPLLVELRKGQNGKRILHLDLIEDNAKHWRGVDVLVFDSAHWWTHSEKWRSWDLVMEGNNVYKDINPIIAYWTGLTTWANWIDLNLNPSRTKVFFRSMSPRHNRENGWSCHNQKEPLEYLSGPHVPEQLVVLQKVVRRMKFPVKIQNITSLTALRRDGHPSVYHEKEKQQLKDKKCDCSHWCLPGVPDTWNELLNAMLI
ncbi:trichome birefringence-like [Striga asiatica]|uniref:Trichome birefringence-like n=1 Tax=Striga asiatica TaxID=4170 RepID=A0A5A7P8E9_STRAF|nr:trichome birefringence-like [Striga asiatica]